MITLAMFKHSTNQGRSPFSSSTGSGSTQEKSFEEYWQKLMNEDTDASSEVSSHWSSENSDECKPKNRNLIKIQIIESHSPLKRKEGLGIDVTENGNFLDPNNLNQ